MSGDDITIYHNPRCSKSREALQRLRASGREPKVVEYLKTPLKEPEIRALLKKLRASAREILRTKESAYKEAGLSRDSTDKEVIVAIAANPILLERPIVVRGSRAVVARPAERVEEIL